jgi:hypothetical protein
VRSRGRQPDRGNAREGWKQLRQCRDGSVLPDGSGPANETLRCTRGTSVVKLLNSSTCSKSGGSGPGRGEPFGLLPFAPSVFFASAGWVRGIVYGSARADAAGAKLGAYFVKRSVVNVGTV